MECPVDEHFDPLDPGYLADPYSVMAALLAGPAGGAPVFFAPSIGYYVVTKYADVARVFGDNVTYSAAVTLAPWRRGRRRCSLAGTGRSRAWSASTSLPTPDCASQPPVRSA